MRHEVNYVLRAVHPKEESLVWVKNNAYLYPSILNFQEEHSSNSWNEANSFFYFLSELSEHNTAFLGYLIFLLITLTGGKNGWLWNLSLCVIVTVH